MSFDLGADAPQYQYTKEGFDGLVTVVGPFSSEGAAREALVEEVSSGHPRMRRAKARKFVAELREGPAGDCPDGRFEALYSIQLRPPVHPSAPETVRRGDAARRERGGVALVHVEGLMRTMGERVPEYLKGAERDAYLEALCDIAIHVNDATAEHQPETGELTTDAPHVTASSEVLGNRRDRTGAWREA